MRQIYSFLAIAFCLICASVQQNYPVVLWHGMGDTCCNPMSMGAIKKLIEENIPNVDVHSIKIGNNFEEEVLDGFFVNINEQIDMACTQIQQNPNLQNGYHAVGFSQGGLFLRAVAQRCPSPPIINLISIGGPQQGVYGFPHCPLNNTQLCDEIRRLLNYAAYEGFVQKFLVQAEYWHDPLKEDEFKANSQFLADINQENKFNQTYRDNMLKLKNVVLVKFNNDTMVVPLESEWFGFYKPGQAVELFDLESSPIYLNDTLGLRTLDYNGRLFKLSVNGDHLRFTDKWFVENIVEPFLKDK